MKKRVKRISMSEKELVDLKMEWYDRGKKQSQKELRTELVHILGLDEMFEPIESDYT